MTTTNRPDHAADMTQALAVAVQRYAEANPLSQAQHRKAAAVMPGGNTRTVLYAEPFPITLVKGSGCTVTSLDGREYVDFLGEYTAGLYGHSNEKIKAATQQALESGWVLGGHTQNEEELARLITERIPSIELIRFANSGTEANLYAISTALAITGRRKVVVFEGAYHGGVFVFAGPPSPLTAPFDFIIAPFNDIEGTAALLEQHRDDIAAVLIEPMQGSGGCIPADTEFLRMLRDWSTQHGSLLIFDEVMTSRLSGGGMQELCGVRPDMTTLGKYIGGGFSFGAFGGRADIMQRYDPASPGAFAHAGTFNNNVFTMAAGATGLRDVFTPERAAVLSERGDRVRERLNAVAREAGVPMQFTGLGSMMNVHMCAGELRSMRSLQSKNIDAVSLFYYDMLERGIWLARRGMINLSLPMGDAECDLLVQAVQQFVDERGALL